jgi:nucleoside-diphosphate-sugar epimerase
MTDEQEKQPLNVYVSGGTTYAGQAVIRQLVANGHSVSSLAHTSAEATLLRECGALPVYGSEDDMGAIRHNLRLMETDTVINLKPQVWNTPPYLRRDWKTITAQFKAETFALIEAAREAEVAYFLHTSFAFLYADTAGNTVDESAPSREPGDVELFAAALEAEVKVRDEMNGGVLRVGYLFSDADDDALHDIQAQVRRGLPMLLGKQSALANWLHAADLATAAVAAAEQQPASASLNVTSDTPLSVYEFIDILCQKLGMNLPPSVPAFAAESIYGKTHAAIMQTSVSLKNDAAKSALGWMPQFGAVSASLDDILLTWRAKTAV